MTIVTIVNQHTNNYGDDAAGTALAEALVEILGADQINIVYFRHGGTGGLPLEEPSFRHVRFAMLAGEHGMGKRVLRQLAEVVLLRNRKNELWQIVDMCNQSDYVFVSPAGANIGVYRDWAYLLVLATLVKFGVNVSLTQNTVGPSGSWAFDRVARYVLKRAQLSVRELKSHLWLQEMRLTSYLGVDTALLRAPASKNLVSDRSGPGYIALVLTQLDSWHRSFITNSGPGRLDDEILAGVQQAASDAGLRVRIVPHVYGPIDEREYLESSRQRLSRLGADVTIANVCNLEDYYASLSGADMVISMRYHGLVIAAYSGVPCISLAYENKMVEAASYLGLGHLSIPVQDATASALRSLAIRALESGFDCDPVVRMKQLRAIAAGPVNSALASDLRCPR